MVAAVQMALMALARIIFALIHVDAATLAAHSDNLPLLLFNALRFDAQVAAYICLPRTMSEHRLWFRRFSRPGESFLNSCEECPSLHSCHESRSLLRQPLFFVQRHKWRM